MQYLSFNPKMKKLDYVVIGAVTSVRSELIFPLSCFCSFSGSLTAAAQADTRYVVVADAAAGLPARLCIRTNITVTTTHEVETDFADEKPEAGTSPQSHGRQVALERLARGSLLLSISRL